MAATQKVRGRKRGQKSEAIREAFETLGMSTTPKEVQEFLKPRKIKVSSALVANVKAGLLGGRRKTRKSNGDGFSVDLLFDAKKFITAAGSVGRRQAAVAMP
jgi:hypothetical protein